MADVGQTLMSGEQSWRFATVNDDEFNRILTGKAGLCLIQCHIIKQLMTFNFGEYKDWSNLIFTSWTVINIQCIIFNDLNMAWVRALLCKLQKGCTRLAAASDQAYQLLAHGMWFSPSTPAPSTTKTGRHDTAEILLKVALNTNNQFHHHYLVRYINTHYHARYINTLPLTCTVYKNTLNVMC